ncbi:DUF5984 family protein [Kitasatospora sp. NPDC004289]
MTDVEPALRFRFGLTPLDRVRPWGSERPVLHWFGLTDGWYGIDLGGHELLRYSERTLRALRATGDGRACPYVDHYVVRLWEDVLELVSEAMEPVPADLADLAGDLAPGWAWEDAPEEADAALAWYGAGFLNTSYLRVAPHLRCRRTVSGPDDTVTLVWEHRADPEGVVEFAGPQRGRVTMPTEDFVAAVAAFDRALLAAMEQRIGALEQAPPAPGVELDLGQLRREQRERAGGLRRALEHRPGTDWEAVRAGVRILLGAKATGRD